MALKDDVLGYLISGGGFISGEALAKRLSVSRSAIGKAVNALRVEGYEIQAVTNRGYMLVDGADILSAQGIKNFLRTDFYSLEIKKSVTSTNDAAKAAAAENRGEGFTVIAESQTAGRGRLGRKFCSPRGTGLYMSILLRPRVPVEMSLFITTAAAVAVAEAIESVSGETAGIKWVNDVFVSGKKVCGILTEGAMDVENGKLQYAVVGIGVNVREPEGGFPEDVRQVAGAVFEKECPPWLRCRLAAGILDNFYSYYRHLEEKPYFAEYKRRSIVLGKNVLIQDRSGGSDTALALDIDENCGLVVKTQSGEIKTLSTGEVSVRL